MHRAVIVLLYYSLSGCEGITADTDHPNIKSKLQVGMTREQVIADELTDAVVKQTLLEIARRYENLAAIAETESERSR
jgi:hypothetical protein